MGTFVNNAGIVFVTSSFRDFIPFNGYFDFKGHVDSLARDKGEYFRFSPIVDVDTEHFVNATVNSEEGVLLGEFIQNNYPDEDNLLYCEQVESDGTSLLVCIQAGSIVIDTLVKPGVISQEIWLQIVHTQAKYKVLVSGNKCSIDWDETRGSNILPSSCINSSERLHNGYCIDADDIPVSCRNASSTKAASRVGIKPMGRRILTLAAVVIIVGVASMLYFTKEEAPVQVAAVPVDLYKSYREALASPSPAGNILAALHLAARASMLPGWKIKEAGLSPTNAFAEMVPEGGSLSDLETFAKRYGLVIRRKDKATVFYSRKVTKPRTFPNVIYKLQDVVNHVSDITNIMYDAKSDAGEMVVIGKVYRRDITVSAKGAMLDDIAMFAESIADLPVVLRDIKAEQVDNYFKFEIFLTAYGEHIDKS